MAKLVTDGELEAERYNLVSDLLRAQISTAVAMHLGFAGQPGFLTIDDIRRELIAALMVVSAHDPVGRNP